MAKGIHDNAFDAALNYVKDRAEYEIICLNDPGLDYAKAVGSLYIGQGAVSAGNFSVTDGTVSGRKLVIQAVNSIVASATASATYVALVTSAAASALLLQTTVTAQVVTIGNPINVPSWKWESTDPT